MWFFVGRYISPALLPGSFAPASVWKGSTKSGRSDSLLDSADSQEGWICAGIVAEDAQFEVRRGEVKEKR